MTVIDKAKRMTHLIPCSQTMTVQQAAQYYCNNVAKLRCVPKFIYTDGGTQFSSKFWKELRGLFGTGLRYRTAFHPQKQGIVERMNAVIGKMLCCTLAGMNESKNWVEISPIVELAINSMPNKNTGNSLYYLTYGHHSTVPSYLIDGSELTQNDFLDDFCMGLSNQTNETCSRGTNRIFQ